MAFATSGVPPLAPLFPVVFVTGWCFVSLFIAQVGGWRELARRYPASGRQPSAGETSFFLGGSMRKLGSPEMRYSGTLILTAAPEGIYLKQLFLFRLFHPPLLLPWSGVQALEQRKVWFGIASVLVFVDDGTTLEIFLSSATRAAVRSAAGARVAVIERPPSLG